MKRLPSLCGLGAIALLATQAQAVEVSGYMDAWTIWSVATDTVNRGCITGEIPCYEHQVASKSLMPQSGPKMQIPVRGRATFRGSQIVSLTLQQSKPVSLPMVGGSEEGGNIDIEDLAWRLEDGKLMQVREARARCDRTAGPGCVEIAKAIQDPTKLDSPLNFDGIPANYAVQDGAVYLDYHQPFVADASDPNAISIDVASHQPAIPPVSVLYNAACLVHFTLSVR